VFRSVNGYIVNVTVKLMETVYFIGIDVSKKKLDSALTIDGKSYHQDELENTTNAIQIFFRGMKKMFGMKPSQMIVCMEHTGIYCLPLLDFLLKNSIKVCLESAMRIKKSQGIARGKSDPIDALRIAQYAYKNREELRYWQPQRSVVQQLKGLLVTRERLVKIRTQLEVPIRECEEFVAEPIRSDMIKNSRRTLKALDLDIRGVEQAIDNLIRTDPGLAEQLRISTSIPGVGKITATNMIIDSGEFTRISDSKKFACHAGVAPFPHKSGTTIRGKTRVSYLANMNMKKLMHLAAMSAIQCDDELKAFYKRKIGEGKNKMSVLNAVRNKLISRVFSCIKSNRVYQKNYQHALA
jgi:transposase